MTQKALGNAWKGVLLSGNQVYSAHILACSAHSTAFPLWRPHQAASERGRLGFYKFCPDRAHVRHFIELDQDPLSYFVFLDACCKVTILAGTVSLEEQETGVRSRGSRLGQTQAPIPAWPLASCVTLGKPFTFSEKHSSGEKGLYLQGDCRIMLGDVSEVPRRRASATVDSTQKAGRRGQGGTE